MAGKEVLEITPIYSRNKSNLPALPLSNVEKNTHLALPLIHFTFFMLPNTWIPEGGGWVAKCRNIPLEIAMCRHKTFGLDGRDFVAFEAGVSRAICIFSIVLYSLEDLNSHFLSRYFISSINKNLQNRSKVHFQTDADDDDEPRKRTPRLRRRTRSTNLFINATRRRSLPYSPSYEQSKTIK